MNNIWWNQVTNAVKYVEDIQTQLLEEKSILLRYTAGMPWREQFEETVIEAVKSQNADKKFVKIKTQEEPGEYLLTEFCKREKRAEYRPGRGYPKFFAENDDIVLHDRYLWVVIDSYDCLEKWMSFVSAYIKERGKNARKAAFILEWNGKQNPPVKRGIKAFSFDDYIGEYDRVVFAVLASSDIREDTLIKQYTAELLANVVENDIELCAECVQEYREFLTSPFEFLKEKAANGCRSDGTPYVFDVTREEVDHRIWLAQIKTIYPYLEEYREDFVQRHAASISRQLPIQASYGEIYTDPKDVELGTLMFMVGEGLLPLNPVEAEKLKLYKDARNRLSHLAVLDLEEITALIQTTAR